MKILHHIMILILISMSGNSMAELAVELSSPSISPSPLNSVTIDGEGTASFVLSTRDEIIPANISPSSNIPNVQMNVDFGTYIGLKDNNNVTGNMMNFFDIVYASERFLLLRQNKDLPANTSLNISMPIETLIDSNDEQNYNGFNANVAALHPFTSAYGNAATFTYTIIPEIDDFDISISTPGLTSLKIDNPSYHPLAKSGIEFYIFNKRASIYVDRVMQNLVIENNTTTGVSPGASDILFKTNNGTITPMVITKNGKIGINTTNPKATLDINGYMKLSVNSSESAICNMAQNGSIALTSGYQLCVCDGENWVVTADGSTSCNW